MCEVRKSEEDNWSNSSFKDKTNLSRAIVRCSKATRIAREPTDVLPHTFQREWSPSPQEPSIEPSMLLPNKAGNLPLWHYHERGAMEPSWAQEQRPRTSIHALKTARTHDRDDQRWALRVVLRNGLVHTPSCMLQRSIECGLQFHGSVAALHMNPHCSNNAIPNPERAVTCSHVCLPSTRDAPAAAAPGKCPSLFGSLLCET
jgi:hypothetical protein